MYAVIDLGGKQYRVHEGEYLTVDRLHHEPGATFTPQVVFAADGDTTILDPKELAKVKVTVHVDAHLLGPKLLIRTYRPKKSSSRRLGHRSRLSKITVQEIAVQKRASRSRKADPAEGEE
jgi:large subunit ribosomal protein L21